MNKIILTLLFLGSFSWILAEEITVYFSAIFTKKGAFYIKAEDYGKNYSEIIEREGLEPYIVEDVEASKFYDIEIKCDKNKNECGYNLIKDYVKEHNEKVREILKNKKEEVNTYNNIFN